MTARKIFHTVQSSYKSARSYSEGMQCYKGQNLIPSSKHLEDNSESQLSY